MMIYNRTNMIEAIVYSVCHVNTQVLGEALDMHEIRALCDEIYDELITGDNPLGMKIPEEFLGGEVIPLLIFRC